MSSRLRIILAQQDFHVGALRRNREIMLQCIRRARDELAGDVIVFPELSLTGYPPEDLLLRDGFISDCQEHLAVLQAEVRGVIAIVGCPLQDSGQLYNAAVVLQDGRELARYYKQTLPNYSVFDEKRYFTPGRDPCVVTTPQARLGVTICEDIWVDGPAEQSVAGGAQILLNLNASPFHVDKRDERHAAAGRQARTLGVPLVYANLVGGQDELVFDGGSFVLDHEGGVVQQVASFTEQLAVADFDVTASGPRVLPATIAPPLPRLESIYAAIVLGVRDYVRKNGFRGAVIGLSGGIDSALTLAIACDALGAENVEAVLMPSRYTSSMSIEDAVAEAEVLGVHHRTIPIEPMFTAFLDGLREAFAGQPADTTEENIQARCRGVILMALSNKQGRIVLTTGNKSEMAVGYATLYGDMAGGYAVIKDVPKTLVFELARWRNRRTPVIPQRVIDRPPSAELAPDQRDEDSLPPYEILDPILELYIEQDRSLDDIIAAGFDRETVRRVVRLVDRNEYKRKQAAPGVRITRRAFGRDRRYPITNRYTQHFLDEE